MSDEELMVRYQAGDLESFKILYKRHAGRVYGYIRSRLRDQEASNEAHQAVFMKLHEARSKYDANFPFSPWLFTICRNVITDALRVRGREVAQIKEFQLATLKPVIVEASTYQTIPIANLPDNQRRAVEMRYLENLSFEEMAKRLGTSTSNSRKLVSRAVASLRKALKGDE